MVVQPLKMLSIWSFCISRMAENSTEGCLFSDTDTTIFQLSKMAETILWQTFADYRFAADDVSKPCTISEDL